MTILGSFLGVWCYCLTEKKRKGLSPFIDRKALEIRWGVAVLLSVLFSELLSRVFLHHDTVYPLLMIRVPSFGLKYAPIVLAISFAMPFMIPPAAALLRSLYHGSDQVLSRAKTWIARYEKGVGKVQLLPEKWEFLLALLLGTAIFCLLTFLSGSIRSGMTLVDDTELYRIRALLDTHTLSDTIRLRVENDLRIRFRPFFMVTLPLKVLLFGLDMNIWMRVYLILGILHFLLLWKLTKLLGAGTVESILFCLLTVFGQQVDPWIRAYNQENDGILLFDLILILLTYTYTEKGSRFRRLSWYRAVIILCSILLSLQKESFTMLLPGILLYIAWLEEREQGERFHMRSAMRENLDYIVGLMMVFLIDIAIIVFAVGTNQIGYAGFSGSTPMTEYLHGLWYTLSDRIRLNSILAIAALALVILSSGVVSFLRKYRFLFLFSLYIMATQLALHAKSAMNRRYVIPFIIGWSTLFVLLSLWQLRGNRSLYRILTVLMICSLPLFLRDSWVRADDWARKGRWAGNIFRSADAAMDAYPHETVLVNFPLYENSLMWREEYLYDVQEAFLWQTEKGKAEQEGRKIEIPGTEWDMIITERAAWEDANGEWFRDTGIDKDDYQEIGAGGGLVIAASHEAVESGYTQGISQTGEK